MKSIFFAKKFLFVVAPAVHLMAFLGLVPGPCHVPFRGIRNREAFARLWTVGKIRKLSKDPRLLAVVESLVGQDASREKGLAPHLQMQAAIDAVPEMEIRRELLMQVGGRHSTKEDLFLFARTEDATATCFSAETAGGYGLQSCAERCSEKGVLWKKRPSEGGCYVLCSLAIAPCGARPFKAAKLFKTAIDNTGNAVTNGVQRTRALSEVFLLQAPRIGQGVITAVRKLSRDSCALLVVGGRLVLSVRELPVLGYAFKSTEDAVLADLRVTICISLMMALLVGVIRGRQRRALRYRFNALRGYNAATRRSRMAER